MTQKWHILIVDDDPQIADLLCDYLEQHGYRVSQARNGREMDRIIEKYQIDLLILDIMLPGEDGVSICRRLRSESDIMIIMLSAAGEEADRIIALELGADDYLTKPFSPRELLARIKALTRRSSGILAAERQKRQMIKIPNVHFLNWTLDRNLRRLIDPEGIIIPLTAGEYELLQAFLENPKRTLTRDQLLDITRGREGLPFDRTIDVQVGRLRKKIEKDPKEPVVIITVRGGGYQFNADVEIEEN